MDKTFNSKRYDYWFLLAFAFTAVASIALQNLIWISVAIFLFLQIKNQKKFNWPSGLFPIATSVFLASFFLGAILGVDPVNSFHTVHKYLTLFLIFPIAAMALGLNDIKNLLLTFVYGAALCSIFGIGKHFILHEERIDSFSGDKIVFGGMLMVSLLILITMLKNSPKNLKLWICLGFIAPALVLTQTRGAWIGFVIGFTLLAWKINRNWLLAGLSILVITFFVMPQSLQERVKSITSLSISYGPNHEINNSSQTRLLIWVAGWKMIKDYPLGVGQGNVSELYPQYRSPVLSAYEKDIPHLHNNFMQILAQNGWIGLAAYLFWIFSYFWTALRFATIEPEAQMMNWIFLCLFTAVLVWGLTEYTFSHQFMNVQFFLLGLQIQIWKDEKVSV